MIANEVEGNLSFKNEEFTVQARSPQNLGIMIGENSWINFDERMSGISKDKMIEELTALNKGDKIKAVMSTKVKFIGFEILEKVALGKSGDKSWNENMLTFNDILNKFNEKYPDYQKDTELPIVILGQITVRVTLTPKGLM